MQSDLINQCQRIRELESALNLRTQAIRRYQVVRDWQTIEHRRLLTQGRYDTPEYWELRAKINRGQLQVQEWSDESVVISRKLLAAVDKMAVEAIHVAQNKIKRTNDPRGPEKGKAA